jgi:hypothetical protein
MNRTIKPVLLSVLLATLSACTNSNSYSYQQPEPAKRITAVGYGTAEKSDKFSRSQIKLMAIRSSKLDAYRSLSEQVYGVRLRGMTTVENMVINHDSYKAFVDAYLRGAKVLRSVAINKDMYAGDDTFETVVELELTPHFYECMSGSPELVNQCLQQPMPPAPESELITPFSSAKPTIQVASVINSTPTQCNSMDCYDYPLTAGFNRPIVKD